MIIADHAGQLGLLASAKPFREEPEWQQDFGKTPPSCLSATSA